jgi:UDP-N-acetyl-2-amino-2-deoxyglucuronate dehydrogenase
MAKLKVAIIGCGRISASYDDAFRKLGDVCEVVGAIDLDAEKARRFAAPFHARSGTSLSDLLSLRPDVLHVCLPHYLHASVTLEALEHGMNVLCEKPLALSLADCDRMIAKAKEKNLKLGCVFQTRYNESVQVLRQKRLDGVFGGLLTARSYLAWNRAPEYYASSDWKGSWEKEGGGVLIDQAIHSLDRVRYLVGSEVVSLRGRIFNDGHPYLPVEDTALASIRFKNGCLYNLYAYDYNGIDTPITIEIVGTKGVFGLIQDVGYSVIDGVREEYREVEAGDVVGPSYWGTTHVMQLKDFYHSVQRNQPVMVDGLEGKKSLEVVKGIYLSAYLNRVVAFPYDESLLPETMDCRGKD